MINVQYESLDFRKASCGQLHFFICHDFCICCHDFCRRFDRLVILGVTKSVTSIQVSSDPTVFVLDTPGIMVPRVDDVETGLKLALTGALPERVVSVEAVVDYLHYVLRTQPRRALAPGVWDVLGMEEGRDKPPDSVQHMLDSVARRYGKNPQTEDAARVCIRSFQKCLLGKITLDSLDS